MKSKDDRVARDTGIFAMQPLVEPVSVAQHAASAKNTAERATDQQARLKQHPPAGSESSCCAGLSPCNPPMESVFSLPPRRKVSVKKAYLIVNPYGGKGRGKIVLKAALEEFQKHGTDVSVLETEHKRHAEEYARSIPLIGYDVLCAIGGDGTFNEVVNGVLTRPVRYQHIARLRKVMSSQL